jgi:hypothetical protein
LAQEKQNRSNELGQIVVIPVPEARKLPRGAPPAFGNPYEDLARALVHQWDRSALRQDLQNAWDWIVRAVSNAPPGYTDKLGKIAKGASDHLRRRVTPDEIRDAIHRAKENLGRGDAVRNPDVFVHPESGDVRPQTPDGGAGDSIGNIYDYLE